MKNWKNLLLLLIIALVAVVIMIKTSGQTHSSKYNAADGAVRSYVRFDDSTPPSRKQAYMQPQGASVNDSARRYEAGAAPSPTVAPRPVNPAPIRDDLLRSAGSAPAPQALGRPVGPPPTSRVAYEEARPTSPDRGFVNYGVNQMIQTADDHLSTFGADVDTASYTIARRMLNERQLPPADSVRVEEYVNYFRYSYPDPDEGAFGVHMEAAPSPFMADANRKILRIGVQGKRATRSTRKPVHLTFLVDVSGSMFGPDRLDLAKKSLKILTQNLGEEDTIAISTYASDAKKFLDPTSVTNRQVILDAIDRLEARGSTSMEDGLGLAYSLAMESFQKGHVNRVIVLSDGDANVGATSHTATLHSIESYVKQGITLSTIGFGMGNYRDDMMEQLANKGNGNNYYIDSEDEARKVFGEQIDGTLQVIAKDMKIQVEFEPAAILSYRLLGYENRDIADEDFRNDAVDAGDVGAGHTVTALYEVVLSPAALQGKFEKYATVRIRHKEPEGDSAREWAFPFTAGQVHPALADSSKDFQFAVAVAGFAEILRHSPYATDLNFALIDELARAASRPDQKMRQEFIGLVQKARQLRHG